MYLTHLLGADGHYNFKMPQVKEAHTGNGSDWRKKREEFVATLRAARRDARMIKKGVKLHRQLG